MALILANSVQICLHFLGAAGGLAGQQEDFADLWVSDDHSDLADLDPSEVKERSHSSAGGSVHDAECVRIHANLGLQRDLVRDFV